MGARLERDALDKRWSDLFARRSPEKEVPGAGADGPIHFLSGPMTLRCLRTNQPANEHFRRAG